MRRKSLMSIGLRLILVVLVLGMWTFAAAQKKKENLTDAQKKARIEELEKQIAAQRDKNRASGPELEKVIERFEKVLQSCVSEGRKNDRCADAMYQLGDLYYDEGRDNFAKASEQYSEAFKAYDKSGRGTRPTPPVPNYSKSLGMYWQLTREYPNFPRLPDAFTRMGNIYLSAGHLDTTRIIFEQLTTRFPASPRVSSAYFRLGDLAFMDNKYNQAYEHFRKVKKEQIDLTSWEMTHYRKGECAYSTGDLDKAVEYFFTYIEECDKGTYQRKEFRNEALEYMAIAFADMTDGVKEAIKFFNKNKGRKYEPDVIFLIGEKNHGHAQWDQAILALSGALKNYPMFRKAPLARQQLIDCFIAKKDMEKANKERESLVDDYGQGSKWYSANSGEKVVIDESRGSVKRALGDIAIYYHSLAQTRRDDALYEKAMKRYNEFFQKFPDDKWKVYEFKYNVAEIYSAMGNCDKAADHYNFVAMEDLARYPAFVQEVDVAGIDPEELEKLKATKGDKTNPIAISQEDAGYNTVVELDKCRKKEMTRDDISGEKAYSLSSTKRLIDQALSFQKRFPQSTNAPDVLFIAGDIYFEGKAYNDAIPILKQIVDNYTNAKIAPSAARRLGQSYANNNQFDLAMQTLKGLLNRTNRDTKEYGEVMELAAGTMYQQADNQKKSGNLAGAAEAFMAISREFGHESQVAARGWFEAGVCFEELKDYSRAAQTFEQMANNFTKSAQREAAFIRAAENFKKADMFNDAARVYLTAANQIPKTEFAIPTLSAASEAYEKMGQFDMAGKMFEEIFARFPADPKTPQALYNAGLTYEKGKLYHPAINVYGVLAQNFSATEFAAEAFYSIGLCYEKLGEFGDMANAFVDFAKKYTGDKNKQVQALVKAGDAYFKLGNDRDAEKSYNDALKVTDQYGKSHDIDPSNVARALYRMGELTYNKFNDVRLDGKNKKEVDAATKRKVELLKAQTGYFTKALELEVEEWTMRSTYKLGQSFYDMANAFAEQTLFGREEEKIGGKINIIGDLVPFIDNAMNLFHQNIKWAKDQNIGGAYVDSSKQALMEMAYKKAAFLEDIGLLFRNAPIPKGMPEDDAMAYAEILEEKYMEFLEKAFPLYGQAILIAKDAGIANSPWLDKIKAKLTEIDPDAEALQIAATIVEWVPTERPKEYDEFGNEIVRRKDTKFDENMRRIQRIVSLETSVDEKIRQLESMMRTTQREIMEEEAKINALKAKKGS